MEPPLSLWTFSLLGFPLLMGLSSSFSHCLGMCGPIQWGLYAGLRNKNGLLYFHLGRGAGYLILGLAGGLIGGAVHALQSPLATRLFTLMLVVLYLAFAFMYFTQNFAVLEKWLQKIPYKLSMSPPVFTQVGRETQTGVRDSSQQTRGKLLLAGMAGGWLPCPMTLGVVTWGLSAPHPGIAVAGMLFLWMGTLPSFVLHYFAGGWRKAWNPKVFRFALGCLFVGLAAWNSFQLKDPLSAHAHHIPQRHGEHREGTHIIHHGDTENTEKESTPYTTETQRTQRRNPHHENQNHH